MGFCAGSDDAFGKVSSRSYNTTTATLSYDGLDQLVKWDNGTGGQEQYVYDASGSRVLQRSTVAGTTTMTVSAFGTEEHQYNGAGVNQANTYSYSLDGHLIGESTGTTTNIFLTDGLGSVITAISATAGSASVQGNQAYGPYGNTRYQAGSMGTAKGFTGQYQDATGLDYYGARYYDPVVGRFLSADIVEGNAVGMDPYAYVGENPETDMDPTGHSNNPFLIYLYFWYASFHPQIVFADLLITFRLYLAGGGVPDIANLGRQLIWEAKTSGDPRTGSILDMGIDFPSDVNILKGSRQAQDYARRAGPGWRVGTLANDPELAEVLQHILWRWWWNMYC
jgi:RHS repeat-associated protein